MRSDPTPENASRITVAIIEDDASIRRLLASWIEESEEFSLIGEYPDAESAALEVRRKKTNIMLVDINLPEASGTAFVGKYKPRVPATQFVMLTVFEDSNSIFESLVAGASGYLSKKTRREALFASLRDLHSGGSPMSSAIARKVVQSFRREPPKNNASSVLAKREWEVLSLLARGHSYKDIAAAMDGSVATVGACARRIYEKLQMNLSIQAATSM